MLRLSNERLLGDKRVRTDGTSVNFVFDKVEKLEHVHSCDRCLVRKRFAGATIEELNFAGFQESCHGPG